MMRWKTKCYKILKPEKLLLNEKKSFITLTADSYRWMLIYNRTKIFFKSNSNWNNKTTSEEEVNTKNNAWKIRMYRRETQQNSHYYRLRQPCFSLGSCWSPSIHTKLKSMSWHCLKCSSGVHIYYIYLYILYIFIQTYMELIKWL